MRQVTNSASSPAAVQRPRRKTRRSFRAPARWLWASRLSVVTSTPGKAYEVAEPRVVPEGGQVNSYDTRAAPGSPPLAGSKLLFRYSPRLDPYWQRITRLVRSVHPGLVRNNQAPLRMGASARRLAVDARRGMAQRQLDGEAAAATRMAGHLDGSPQDQHQLAHHGEAEANPARRAGVGDVDLVETLEDAVQLRHGDADAVVLDADSELVALGAGAEQAGAVGRGVLDRVLQQVAEHLAEAAPVGQDRRQVNGQVEAHPHRRRAEPLHRVAAGVGHANPAELGGELAAVQLGGGEQALDQAEEPFGLAFDDVEELLPLAVPGRRRQTSQGVGVADDRGQGGAHLVRGDRHELALEAAQLPQLGHAAPLPLQVGGQLARLVGQDQVALGEALVQVAGLEA